MKRWMWGFLVVTIISCREADHTSDYTGNEATYDLQSGSMYNITGTVTLREMRSGETEVVVKLNGTSGDAKLPVHLHMGVSLLRERM